MNTEIMLAWMDVFLQITLADTPKRGNGQYFGPGSAF